MVLDTCGQTLVEFALVGFMLIAVILSVVEVSRLMLVYTTVADAAREGARYAIVHGSDSSSPAAASDVIQAVRSFAGGGLVTSSLLNITVSPDPVGTAGTSVTVQVTYPYDPFTTYFPWGVTLGSKSQGVVTF